MGIIVEGIKTIITLDREINGKIWDPVNEIWLPATVESEEAADQAIGGILSSMLDLVPFPIEVNVLGIVQLNIGRVDMQTTLGKIHRVLKTYIQATTATAQEPVLPKL